MTAQVLSPATSATNATNNNDTPTTGGGLDVRKTNKTTTTATMSYRDNATDILPLRVTVTDPDYKDQMKTVVKALCPFLKGHDNDSLSIVALGGGLSNELFIVSIINNGSSSNNNTKSSGGDNSSNVNEDDDAAVEEKKEEQELQQKQQQSSVLVRIHPTASTATSSTENSGNGNAASPLPSIVDRDIENAISAWLSSQNVGPTYYGRFLNGRVEEFYPNHSTLSWKDMGKFGPTHVAPIMAQFHSLRVPSTVMTQQNSSSNSGNEEVGDIFYRVREWMALAEQLCQKQQQQQSSVVPNDTSSNDSNKENDEKTATTTTASVLLEQLKQDWMWLEEKLLKRPANSNTTEEPQQPIVPAAAAAATKFLNEIVFTHMDMQSLNLLRDDNTATTTTTKDDNDVIIRVIDFEYSGFNPRAVDMANTFCEHCDMNNINADYPNEYPTPEIQNAFVQSYIRNSLLNVRQRGGVAAASTTTTTKGDTKTTDEEELEQYLDDPIFFETARTIIGRYSLVSHLSWAIWSIVQAHMSDIDFDYIQYASHRRDGFFFAKAKFF